MGASPNPAGRDGINVLFGLMALGALILAVAVLSLLALCGCTTARIEVLDRDGRIVARGNLSRVLSASKEQEVTLKPDGTLVYSVGESDGTAVAGEIVGAAVQAAISGAGAGK